MAIFSKKKSDGEKKPEKAAASAATVDHLAWKVLVEPYVSEKATDLAKENRYVFRVADDSNKIQIKKAVKELYGVDAVSVNIVNIPRRKKRLGKYRGWKKGFKKAVVEVKEGQRIDATPK